MTTTHTWRRRCTAEISMSRCWWITVSWQPDSPIISLSASKYGSLHCSWEAGYRNHLDINYEETSQWILLCCANAVHHKISCAVLALTAVFLCMCACHLIQACFKWIQSHFQEVFSTPPGLHTFTWLHLVEKMYRLISAGLHFKLVYIKFEVWHKLKWKKTAKLDLVLFPVLSYENRCM